MGKMSKSKDKHNGGIPHLVVNQLVEHTAGGFVLFYYNSETGSPEQMMTFDSPAHCLGLQKYITDWCIALGDMNIESARYDIYQTVKDDPTDGAEPTEESF